MTFYVVQDVKSGEYLSEFKRDSDGWCLSFWHGLDDAILFQSYEKCKIFENLQGMRIVEYKIK
jgi:hypothetical protein